MKEKVELRIEKDLYEELFENLKKLKDRVTIEKAKTNDPVLGFKEVGENEFRIYNKKTGRFHNLELGIDEVV
jgi:ABC-type uncharacterized transport system permease subunit